MKKALFVVGICSILISACSQRPMKLTEGNYTVSPIVIKDNSSDALKFLNSQGAYTVRDLTKAEFASLQKDVAEYSKTHQLYEANSDSGIAYAVGSTAVGTGLGLSLGYASKLSLIGMLSGIGGASYEGENYPFAWDYSSSHFLMRKGGDIDLDVVKQTMDTVVEQYAALMPDIYKATITRSSEVVKVEGKFIPATDIAYTKNIGFKKNDGSGRSGSASIFVQCPIDGEPVHRFCKASFNIRSVNDRYLLNNAMREEFIRKLGPEYALYIPPNTGYKNVPAILYGNGLIEYLVEK